MHHFTSPPRGGSESGHHGVHPKTHLTRTSPQVVPTLRVTKSSNRRDNSADKTATLVSPVTWAPVFIRHYLSFATLRSAPSPSRNNIASELFSLQILPRDIKLPQKVQAASRSKPKHRRALSRNDCDEKHKLYNRVTSAQSSSRGSLGFVACFLGRLLLSSKTHQTQNSGKATENALIYSRDPVPARKGETCVDMLRISV